jgi:uncharacterized membrane protein
MDTKPPDTPGAPADSAPPVYLRVWRNICDRVLGGLILVLPILITFWIIRWLYSILEKNIIDPLAMLVLWKLKWTTASTELPYWFETFAAPVLALVVALVLLYYVDYFADTRLSHALGWTLRRVPVVSHVYNPMREMFQALEKQPGQPSAQRLVLVTFPHPGTKLPAFVTGVCRDAETQKTLLCVYIPTTPMPTSGFFLLVPEEEVTELNWDSQQTLQAIMSGGLTVPPVVSYFKTRPAGDSKPAAALLQNEAPPGPQVGDHPHPA